MRQDWRVEFTQGCTERRRFPLRAYKQRPPRPVQTGGGRSVTPSSTQLVSSSSGSQVARRLPGRHSSVTASPLRCRTGLSCGAQRLGETATLVPSWWCFARRHMLTLVS